MAHTTLYLESFGLGLRKSGNALKIRVRDQKPREVPVMRVDAVVVASDGVSLSGGAVRLCLEHGIPIYFMNPDKSPAMLAPTESRRPERQAAQIRVQDQPLKLFCLARGFVSGKIRNQCALMGYFKSRNQGNGFAKGLKAYEAKVKALLEQLGQIYPTEDPELARHRLFAAEGQAARQYWGLFGQLLDPGLGFGGRSGKGAEDPVNALLNYGYAVLASRIHAAIVKAGFSTYFSFLHTPRKQRPGLVYDLIEEFRPWAVDRVVLAFLGRGRQVKTDEAGLLDIEVRRDLVRRLEARWEKDDLNKRMDTQLDLLAQALEDGGEYPAVRYYRNGAIKTGRIKG